MTIVFERIIDPPDSSDEVDVFGNATTSEPNQAQGVGPGPIGPGLGCNLIPAPGNSMFNILGNLVHNREAGLVIPDFERGRSLQLTGSAVTIWDQNDPANKTGGTRRFVEMTVSRWQELTLPSDLKAELLDYSSFNPPVVAP